MSQETKATEVATAKVYDFIIGKINGAFVKFPTAESVPEGVETITGESVQAMAKEALDDLYGQVARISPKKFKSRIVALESLEYQVNKLPVHGATTSPQAAAVLAGAVANKTSAATAKVAKKSEDTFELLSPPDVDQVIRSLAPQARELVSIMTDLAKEKVSTKFSGADLEAMLIVPEVAARLRTKQDPRRILQYYKGTLITKGMIRVS